MIPRTHTIALGLLGAAFLAVFCAAYWFSGRPAPVGCTMEAKICLDGSAVGRTGPQCTFAPCPEAIVPSDWKSAIDPESGITLRYPEVLPTTYVRALDWPPRIVRYPQVFSCVEAGSEIERAGRTELRIINNHTYCVTTMTEGAAGSIYTQYAYVWARGDETLALTFSTRAPQCGNYPDTERIACESERATFDLDVLIDRIAGTVRGSGV